MADINSDFNPVQLIYFLLAAIHDTDDYVYNHNNISVFIFQTIIIFNQCNILDVIIDEIFF